MTNTTKMTKKDYFNALLAIESVATNKELVDFINHELELIAKKNASEKKPTENQIANKGYEKAILDFLSAEDSEGNLKHFTITEIWKGIDTEGVLTNQRVSAIVRNLITAGKVQREEVKRKAYFFLAD